MTDKIKKKLVKKKIKENKKPSLEELAPGANAIRFGRPNFFMWVAVPKSPRPIKRTFKKPFIVSPDEDKVLQEAIIAIKAP